MKLSLIIPAFNEEKYIGDCLESVREYGKDLYEVIVVNNASTDKTAEIAGSFPFARVVTETRKGLVWARERGFREARGDLLAYIDADCRLTPNWLGIITKEFSERPNLVGLSGPYRYYDLSFFRKFLAEAGWWIAAPITYRVVGYAILGGNFVARRDAVEKMRGFNVNEVTFYGEDTDIARRLANFGKIVFRMDFFVNSSGRRLTGEGLIKTYYLYAMNFIWEVLFGKPFTNDYKDVR